MQTNRQINSFSYSPIKLGDDLPANLSSVYIQRDKTISNLHFHNHHELGVCLEGAGIFVVEGKILPFKANDCIFIADRNAHRLIPI